MNNDKFTSSSVNNRFSTNYKPTPEQKAAYEKFYGLEPLTYLNDVKDSKVEYPNQIVEALKMLGVIALIMLVMFFIMFWHEIIITLGY